MELRHLRWFLDVVDAGSLSAAARAGHITQPALSVMMSQLERDLGARLFDRGRDGVRLTPAGAAVAETARRIVADADFVRLAARAARDADAGEIRVGIADPGLVPLIADAVTSVRAASVSVRFIVGRHRPWELDGLARGEVHLAIVSAPLLDPRVRTVLLETESRGILVGPRNELFDAADRDLTFETLAEQATVDPVATPPEWMDDWAYRRQMNGERMRRAGPAVDSMAATFVSALTSKAVAFAPRRVGRTGEALGLRYLEPADGPPCAHLLAWRGTLSVGAGLLVAAATRTL